MGSRKEYQVYNIKTDGRGSRKEYQVYKMKTEQATPTRVSPWSTASRR